MQKNWLCWIINGWYNSTDEERKWVSILCFAVFKRLFGVILTSHDFHQQLCSRVCGQCPVSGTCPSLLQSGQGWRTGVQPLRRVMGTKSILQGAPGPHPLLQ